MENFPLPPRWFLNSISIRIRPARKVAITSTPAWFRRRDSQIPWNKVGIDYLGTQECGGKSFLAMASVRFASLLHAVDGDKKVPLRNIYTK